MHRSGFDRWMNMSPWRPLLACVVFMVLGLVFGLWPETFVREESLLWTRRSPGFARTLGIFCVVFSGLCLVAGTVRGIRHRGHVDQIANLTLSGFADAAEYERRKPSWECNDSYPDMSAALQAATNWRLGAGAASIVEDIEVQGSTGRVRAVVDRNAVELSP